MDISMDISMDIHEKICGYGCGYGWEISYSRQAGTRAYRPIRAPRLLSPLIDHKHVHYENL